MDPSTCLLRLLGAWESSDWEEMDSALIDLRTWLRKGGFLPVLTAEGLERMLMLAQDAVNGAIERLDYFPEGLTSGDLADQD